MNDFDEKLFNEILEKNDKFLKDPKMNDYDKNGIPYWEKNNIPVMKNEDLPEFLDQKRYLIPGVLLVAIMKIRYFLFGSVIFLLFSDIFLNTEEIVAIARVLLVLNLTFIIGIFIWIYYGKGLRHGFKIR
jgi:hypothetical protein